MRLSNCSGHAARRFILNPAWALCVLTLIMMVNILDRQIVGILAEPIKRDLSLSDTQVGLLTGLAFSLLYAILGIPVGAVADRGDRPRIIAVATALWSAMTLLCGLASSYPMLALARMGVSVGEAGCLPPVYSLISELFDTTRRARALAVFQFAGPLGTLIAFAIGGWIAQAFGWRSGFLVAAVPGIILAAMAWRLLPESRRTRATTESDPAGLRLRSVAETIRALFAIPAYRRLIVGSVCGSFGLYSFSTWTPALFQRVYGWSLGKTGATLGLVIGIGGVLGALISGTVADRLLRRDPGAHALIPAFMACGAGLLSAAAMAFRSPIPAAVLFALYVPLSQGWQPSSSAAVQGVVAEHQRAISMATLTLFSNLIGYGCGPLLVGVVSDLTAAEFSRDSLRIALLVPAVVYLFGAYQYFAAARAIRESHGE